ncbi:MAG: PaaI family thioesterase, partial [Chloroflexi bacterium]|nr:PaaI family thioesterase [Chloroflexota bacterium]
DVGSEIVGHTTTELNITYLAPGQTPEVVAEARALRKGRNLFVGAVEIKDANGRLAAAGRATYMVFRPAP